MIREPSVSVIIPFYNTPGRFFAEAVESVLLQSFDSWELLLVDDGSAGECSALAQAWALRHPGRVRYLEHHGHENRGLSASRMLGVWAARGKYIAFLDSDDLWLPRKLEQQIALMAAHPEAAMVYGKSQYWYSWTGDEQDRLRDYTPQVGVRGATLVAPPKLLPLYLRGLAAVPCTCSILIRREIFDEIGGFEDSFRAMYEDQAFYAKVCLATPILVADVCWDRYRQHPTSMCSVAERTGQERAARLAFLHWLEGYITERRINNHELWAALREELARCDQAGRQRLPRGARIKRRVRKFMSRIRGYVV